MQKKAVTWDRRIKQHETEKYIGRCKSVSTLNVNRYNNTIKRQTLRYQFKNQNKIQPYVLYRGHSLDFKIINYCVCVCVSVSVSVCVFSCPVVSNSLGSHGLYLPGILFMEFSRREHWSELPFPTAGDLSDPGITPESPALAGGFFMTSTNVKPYMTQQFYS